VLGRSVERVLGPLRLAGLVLASALVSSAGQLAWSDETGIGFSGVGYALFGLAWVPWSPTWNAARALSAYHRADYRSAADWLDRSLRRGANAAWIAETKAMVHWQAGEREEARADIDALRGIDARRAERFERQLHGEEK